MSGLERGPGCHPERLAVILSAAKDLCVRRARPFAEFTLSEAHGLRVTGIFVYTTKGVPAARVRRRYNAPSEA